MVIGLPGRLRLRRERIAARKRVGECGAPVPEGYHMRLILQREVGEATNDKVT